MSREDVIENFIYTYTYIHLSICGKSYLSEWAMYYSPI